MSITLKTQYQYEMRPVIMAVILETKNQTDLEQQWAIRKAYRWPATLVPVKAWEGLVRELRMQYYKHKKFL